MSNHDPQPSVQNTPHIELEKWGLGGNMIGFGAVIPTGETAVWYPGGLDDDPWEGGTLCVFAADDEDWIDPVVVEPAADIEVARAILAARLD